MAVITGVVRGEHVGVVHRIVVADESLVDSVRNELSRYLGWENIRVFSARTPKFHQHHQHNR